MSISFLYTEQFKICKSQIGPSIYTYKYLKSPKPHGSVKTYFTRGQLDLEKFRMQKLRVQKYVLYTYLYLYLSRVSLSVCGSTTWDEWLVEILKPTCWRSPGSPTSLLTRGESEVHYLSPSEM